MLNTVLQPRPPATDKFTNLYSLHAMLSPNHIFLSWRQRLCSMCLWDNLLTHPHLERQVLASPEFLQVQLRLQSSKDLKWYLQQEEVTQNLPPADVVVPAFRACSPYSHPHCGLTSAPSTPQRATWKGRWQAVLELLVSSPGSLEPSGLFHHIPLSCIHITNKWSYCVIGPLWAEWSVLRLITCTLHRPGAKR